jgi:hypothetical protein
MRLVVIALLLVLSPVVNALAAPDLELRASAKYDALCFAGVLTGDPFYVDYYRDDYERFSKLMTPAETEAFHKLKTIIKDENGGLVGPQLTLLLSVIDAETMPELIQAVEHPAAWKAALKTRGLEPGKALAADWTAKDWQEFDDIRAPLAVALRFFDRVHFEAIWTKEWKPAIDARISALQSQLGDTRFIDEQTKLLGFRPVQGPMTAYLVRFSKPHGIRITGPRYITAYDYPLEIILRNAVHEPMHPPFQSANAAFWAALAPLKSDADFMNHLQNHDPDFGYNTFEGLVEEDSVQALEQIVEEQMGVAKPAAEHWTKSDDGLHILAAAIYALMKADAYDRTGGNFGVWLSSPKTVSRLAGHVKELAESVMGPGTVTPLPPRAH